MTMYLDHFGLREAPFKITPHTEFFFAGANRGETLEALIYAITSGEGIVKVTGEVGAGKTMLCRVLIERLPKTVETIYFAVPSLSPDELLATVASDLGVETDGTNITKLIRALQVRLIEIYASGKRVVALIDEAHAMPVESLEQIRLLSNLETSHEKLIQIVLFGQPELDQHLSMPNIRQLKERITHSFNLLPLPARDIKDYLNFRLRAAGYHGPDLFSTEALKLITEASEGLTRRINIYADKTLLAAFAAGTHTVTTDHVRAAIADTQIVLRGPKFSPKKLWLAIAASLLLGAGVGFGVSQYASFSAPVSNPPTTSTPTVSINPPSPALGDIKKTSDVTVSPVAMATSAAPNSASAMSVNDSTARPAVGPVMPIQPTLISPPKATAATADVAPVRTNAKVASTAVATKVEKTAEADWLGKRLLADAARIEGQPKDRYAVQLMTADQRGLFAIEAYLRAATAALKAEEIVMFPTGSVANPRVSVLYGNFEGPAAAAAALAGLPASISKFRPYIRSYGAVREDLRAGPP